MRERKQRPLWDKRTIFERVLIMVLVAVLAVQCATYQNLMALANPVDPTVPTETKPVEPETTAPKETEPKEEEPIDPIDPYRNHAKTILADMTLEEKIWQMFIVDIDNLTGANPTKKSGPKTEEAIKKKPVGGVIYFADNLEDRTQTDAMIRNLQSYASIELFIGVDEEGGTKRNGGVTRLGGRSDFGVTDFGLMYNVGETKDITKAHKVGETLGMQLRELGFNLDFAPVADVWTNPDNTVIGKRAFSTDPDNAASMVRNCVGGFEKANLLCTLKHFPGHGDTKADSHKGSVYSEKTLEELWECELRPFRAGIDAGAPLVMMGHITLPNVEGAEEVPATLSKAIVTDLLRNEMGFQGLVVTDAMNMGAITDHYGSGDAAVLAIQAGVDLILMPADLDQAFQGIRKAVENGDLSEERIDESVLRILETKLRYNIIKMPEV